MTKHPRMIAAIALVTLTAVALTGCLVEKKDPEPPNYRTTDNLRIYKQGDWIQYNVIATTTLSGTSIGSNAQAGTLKVSWGNYSTLTSPDGNAGNDGEPYDVIEKRYLFCLDGASCNPTETVVIQYVHQDDPTINPASAGTERLVAMGGHPTTGQYYWLNSNGGSNGFAPPSDPVIGGQETVITLKSPLFINDYTVKYNLMDNCYTGTPGCLYNVGESTTSIEIVGDSTPINTNIGNYANPFQVKFTGSVFPDIDVGGQLPLTFDIFDLCSDGNSTHYGHMYIVPEIGVIQIRNTCQDLVGNGIRYDITIDSISSSILSGS